MPSSGGKGTSESIGISSPFLEASGRMGIFLAVPGAVLVTAALIFEQLVDFGLRSLDACFDLAGDLGLDDQDVVGLVEGVVGDGKLDLRLGELGRIFAFEKPSGALPTFSAIPNLLAISTLAGHFAPFYGVTKPASSGAGNSPHVYAGKEGNLIIGKGEEEELGDGFFDFLGNGFRSAAWVFGHKH